MTEEKWKRRMELLASCCKCNTMCKTSHKPTGKWALVGFGLDGDVAVMTGNASSPNLSVGGKLLLRWGSRKSLSQELQLKGEAIQPYVYADAIMDRLIVGTWDNSKDSPKMADAELIVTE